MLVFGDIITGTDKPGDGVCSDNLQVHSVGMFIYKAEELHAEDGDLFVYAFNFERLIKLERLGFIKNLAVEPMLPGILVAFGCASGLLFCHKLL